MTGKYNKPEVEFVELRLEERVAYGCTWLHIPGESTNNPNITPECGRMGFADS